MTNCKSLGVAGCRSRKGLGAYDAEGNYVFDDPSNVTAIIPVQTISPSPGYVAPTTTPSATTKWLENLISGVAKTGENILTAKNTVRGVYTATGPGGQTVTYVQPAGNPTNIFGASQTSVLGGVTGTSSSMGLILVGGAALLLVFMMAKK
jgi:hypothetical protein